jgi:hypothetical protein
MRTVGARWRVGGGVLTILVTAVDLAEDARLLKVRDRKGEMDGMTYGSVML